MFKVIRVSSGYEALVVFSSSLGDREDPNGKYYLYNDRIVKDSAGKEKDWDKLRQLIAEGKAEAVFDEVPDSVAMQYFCHHADGMGFGELPKDWFESLNDIWEWRTKQEREFWFGLAFKDGVKDELLLAILEDGNQLTEHGLRYYCRKYNVEDQIPRLLELCRGKLFRPAGHVPK